MNSGIESERVPKSREESQRVAKSREKWQRIAESGKELQRVLKPARLSEIVFRSFRSFGCNLPVYLMRSW